MKVLFLAPYVYNPEINFTVYNTGFGIYVRKMAEKLAEQKHDISVLTSLNSTDGIVNNNVHYLNHKKYHSFFLLTNYKYILFGFRLACKYKKSKSTWKNILYAFYYAGFTGYVKKILRNGNFDIVHIHSIGLRMIPFLYACSELSSKVIITLHDLRIGSQLDNEDDFEAEFEKRFLKYWIKVNAQITVISSGMKQRIIRLLKMESNNFKVILNGTDFVRQKFNQCSFLIDEYQLQAKKNIFLYIGSINERKNQIQLIHAISLLDHSVLKTMKVLLLGENTLGNQVTDVINNLSLQDVIVICGFVKSELIPEFLNIADYNILLSKREAFGLSIIESMKYGIPSLCFSDMDAINDIFHEKCMVKIEERTDKAIAEGIELMINTEWDRDFIISFSDNYGLDNVMNNYYCEYKNIEPLTIKPSDIINLIK